MKRNLFSIQKRFVASTDFVLNAPSETKLHDIVNESKLFQRVVEKYGSENNSLITDSANRSDYLRITSPITNKPICDIKETKLNELDEKINKINKSFISWSEFTAKKRSKILLNFGEIIEKNNKELAQILSLENGKPISEASAEVASGTAACEWFAGEVRRAYGQVIPAVANNHTAFTLKQPVGPCSMITPWNFPSSMVTRKTLPALAAGCTVILKPAEVTPLSALALKVLSEDAGIPEDAFQIVVAKPDNVHEIGEKMFSDERIKGVSFTGSTAVGSILLKHAAGTIKKNCMELGGNAPFIVFRSANIRQAVDGLISSKFRNCGQVCIAPNRVLVHTDIYENFLAVLQTRMTERLRFGLPEDTKTTLGPQIYKPAIEKLNEFITDAVAKGGKIVLGGNERTDLGELFFEPTIVSDVNTEMDLFKNEIFGPIAAVTKFTDEIQAYELANLGNHGLAAYVYSSDTAQLWRATHKIETGMLAVNDAAISTIEYPFGGVRSSGSGREGGSYGIQSYMETKLINWNFGF